MSFTAGFLGHHFTSGLPSGVDPKRMPDLYDANDIYLNSPNIDNMPGSILEAFTSGLPVVTTDAGGIPYIVTEETGLMVQRGDHESMASCAIRLLEDEALAANMAENARKESLKYTWATVRNEWLDLYYRLANNGSSKHQGENDAARPTAEGAELGTRQGFSLSPLDLVSGL